MTKIVETPDWSREKPRRWWDPPRQLLRSIRRYQSACESGSALAGLRRRYWVIQHRFWSFVSGAEIHLTTKIGGGLLIPHPNGIVIHPDIEIGANCMIFQQVTLGTNRNKVGVPKVGTHVDIGAGAKVLGPVTLGDGAVIGANSVVTKSVPERGVALGVPAQIHDSSP